MKQYRHFKLSVLGDGLEELNRFIRTVSLLSEERQFVSNGESSFWAILICYELTEPTNSYDKSKNKKPQKNYEKILNSREYACFCDLREYRSRASKMEHLPAYAVFTNDMAEEMIKLSEISQTKLAEIDGFGGAKQKKYGEAIFEILDSSRQCNSLLI